MKIYLLLGLLILSVSVPAQALTARQYYDEFRSKSAFARHTNVFVCFPDEDLGDFSIIAKTKYMKDEIVRFFGQDIKKPSPLEDYLVEMVYTMGKPSEHNLYIRKHNDSEAVWQKKRTSGFREKSMYEIDWSTGRYSFQIYTHENNIPSYVEDGNCERVQPLTKK